MGGIAELIKDIGATIGKRTAAAKNKKSAEHDRAERMALINQMDFEPMYASAQVPTYQKTQSPVARSYLESFLMGNNPNATFSGAPNAGATQKAQQSQQNAMFGTPEARVARQREIDAATPWKVTPPTRTVLQNSGEALFAAENPILARKGFTEAEAGQYFAPAQNPAAVENMFASRMFGKDKDELKKGQGKR